MWICKLLTRNFCPEATFSKQVVTASISEREDKAASLAPLRATESPHVSVLQQGHLHARQMERDGASGDKLDTNTRLE